MSFAVDANILVYASQPESPYHAGSLRFLETCTLGGELLCLSWPTIAAYLRVTTYPLIFPSPLSTEEATRNIATLLALPRTRVLAEDEGFWVLFRDLLVTHRARGKLVHDVHLAALLKHHGVRTLFTRDRDFRRFDFLDMRDPLAA